MRGSQLKVLAGKMLTRCSGFMHVKDQRRGDLFLQASRRHHGRKHAWLQLQASRQHLSHAAFRFIVEDAPAESPNTNTKRIHNG